LDASLSWSSLEDRDKTFVAALADDNPRISFPAGSEGSKKETTAFFLEYVMRHVRRKTPILVGIFNLMR
jgi:hypothetical protein